MKIVQTQQIIPTIANPPIQAAPISNLRVGERLLAAACITPDQLQIALHEQRSCRELLGTILVRLGFLSETILANILALRSGHQSIDLSQSAPDAELIKRLPRAIAEHCHALPLDHSSGMLSLAMADPR